MNAVTTLHPIGAKAPKDVSDIKKARDCLNQALDYAMHASEDPDDAEAVAIFEGRVEKRLQQALVCIKGYLSQSVMPFIAPFAASACVVAWSLKEYVWP